MSHLRRKYARLLALLALVAGLLGAATPSLAVPAATKPMTMAMMGIACDHGDEHHRQAPRHHFPTGDCCILGVCAMSLALPAAPTALVEPGFPETLGYGLPALLQPAGIVTAPIPYPPKSIA